MGAINRSQLEQDRLNGELYSSISTEAIDSIKRLIEKGSQVNVPSNSNCFHPLVFACKKGNKEIVEMLIKEGADPNINKEGRFEASNVSGVGYYEKPLFMAIESLHADIVSQLLRHGADPDALDKHGCPAITFALGRSSSNKQMFNMVKILLEHSADVNNRSSNGATALMNAIGARNEAAIIFLLKNNAVLTPDDFVDMKSRIHIEVDAKIISMIEDDHLLKAGKSALDSPPTSVVSSAKRNRL